MRRADGGVLAAQASMGWPAWMVASQAAAHVPACSISALPNPGETRAKLPQVGLWAALGEKSQRRDLAQASCCWGLETQPPLQLMSPSWIPPCWAAAKGFPTEKQEVQDQRLGAEGGG